MSNRRISVPFDPQKLLNWMKENGYSNRKLAKMLDRNESAIRRYLKTGEMPQEVMDRLYLFVVHMNTMDQIMKNAYEMHNAKLQELKEQYLRAKYAYLNYKRRIENHEV